MMQWGLIGTMLGFFAIVAVALVLLALRITFSNRRKRKEAKSVQQLMIVLTPLHTAEDIEEISTKLKRKFSPQVLEEGLKQWIGDFPSQKQQGLQRLYRPLGIDVYYQKMLQESRDWVRRTEAAIHLGLIGLPEAVPFLVARLKDPDEEENNVKRSCGEALAKIHDPSVLPVLVETLRVTNDWTRNWIEDAIAHFDREALSHLVPLLTRQERADIRIIAIRLLGKIGNTEVTPMLIQGFNDPDEHVRVACANALGDLKDSSALNDLIFRMMEDPSTEVRCAAATALSNQSSDRAMECLAEALRQPDPAVRERAMQCLEKFGAPVNPLLLPILDESDLHLRTLAASILDRLGIVNQYIVQFQSKDIEALHEAESRLIQIGRAGSFESLFAASNHQNEIVRKWLCRVFGEIGGDRVVPTLLTLSSDPVWDVRAQAIEALAKVSGGDAEGAILNALNDPIEAVAEVASKELNKIPKEKLLKKADQLAILLQSSNIQICLYALDALAKLDNDIAKNAIYSNLLSPHVQVRSQVIKLLSEEPDICPTEELLKLLDDPAPQVRRAVLNSLDRRRDPSVIEDLIACIPSLDASLVSHCVMVLFRTGEDKPAILNALLDLKSDRGQQAAAIFLGLTKDKQWESQLEIWSNHHLPEVRAAVIWAFAQLQGIDAKVLRERLYDGDRKVRAAAVRALGKVGDYASIPMLVKYLEEDSDEEVRYESCLALGRLNATSAVRQLLKIAEINNSPGEGVACVALGLMEDVGARGKALALLSEGDLWSEVTKILSKESEEIRSRFLRHLHIQADLYQFKVDGGGNVSLPAKYAEVLNNSEPEQRLEAVRALSLLNCQVEYEGKLVSMVMEDPVPDVRAETLSSLLQARSSSALQGVLKNSLKDPARVVVLRAIEGLQYSDVEEADTLLIECFRRNDDEISEKVSDCLAARYHDSPEFILQEFEKVLDLQRRCGLITVMGKLQSKDVTSLLLTILHESGSLEERIAAAVAIGKTKDTSTVSLLEDLLTDPSESLRAAIVTALGEIGGKEACRIIAKAGADPSAIVRMEICRAIRKIPTNQIDPRYVTKIISNQLASDQDPIIQAHAFLTMIMFGVDTRLFINELKALSLQHGALIEDLLEEELIADRLRSTLTTAVDPKDRLYALQVIVALPSRPFLPQIEGALRDPQEEVRKLAELTLRQHKYAA